MIGLDNDFSTLENVAGSWLSLGGGWLKNLSRTTILPASFDGCGGKTSTQGKRRIFNGFDVSQREREREKALFHFTTITRNLLYKLWDSCASSEGSELLLSCF